MSTAVAHLYASSVHFFDSCRWQEAVSRRGGPLLVMARKSRSMRALAAACSWEGVAGDVDVLLRRARRDLTPSLGRRERGTGPRGRAALLLAAPRVGAELGATYVRAAQSASRAAVAEQFVAMSPARLLTPGELLRTQRQVQSPLSN